MYWDTICTFSYFVVLENIHQIGPIEAIIRNFKEGKGGKTNSVKLSNENT